MIALDTNVLLRFLVVDEETPDHSLAARGAVADAIARGEQIFIPITVPSEVVWRCCVGGTAQRTSRTTLGWSWRLEPARESSSASTDSSFVPRT